VRELVGIFTRVLRKEKGLKAEKLRQVLFLQRSY